MTQSTDGRAILNPSKIEFLWSSTVLKYSTRSARLILFVKNNDLATFGDTYLTILQIQNLLNKATFLILPWHTVNCKHMQSNKNVSISELCCTWLDNQYCLSRGSKEIAPWNYYITWCYWPFFKELPWRNNLLCTVGASIYMQMFLNWTNVSVRELHNFLETITV